MLDQEQVETMTKMLTQVWQSIHDTLLYVTKKATED